MDEIFGVIVETITKIFITFLIITAFIFLGCNGQEKNVEDPIVAPKDFDIELLEILVCPENLTSLCLARKSEIEKANELITENKLKYWNGSTVKDSILLDYLHHLALQNLHNLDL